jgi:3-phenylpropionate/trans-cinnamate dioxygenase ferredoxin reductase subunit
MSAKPVFLIVGASLAGAKAAEELRTQGFDGRVVLIGAVRRPTSTRTASTRSRRSSSRPA